MHEAALSDRRRAILRRAVIGGWVFSTVFVLGALVLWSVKGFPDLPLSFLHGVGANFGVALLALTYATVGAMLALRRLTNVIGWLFLATGTLLSFVVPLNLFVSDATHSFRPIPAATLIIAWAVSSIVAPMAAGTAFVVSVIFPGDRRPGPWHSLVLVNGVGFALVAVASALNPGGLPWFPTLPNPVQLPERLTGAVRILQLGAVSVAVFGMLAVTASLPIRYRRSDPQLRVQLRWIIAAIAILPPTVAPLFIARYALSAPPQVGEMLTVLAAVGGCAFPIAVAIAIMRHHLFGIERLVERALVYVPLTAILAGLYAASVALFQRVFMSLTGTSSDLTVVVSALILAGTFTPIRQALERFVDRRFNPKKPVATGPAVMVAHPVGEPSIMPAHVVAAVPIPPSSATASPAQGRSPLGEPVSSAPAANGARAPEGAVEPAVAPGVGPAVAPAATPGADAGVDPTAAALTVLAERLGAIEARLARIEGASVAFASGSSSQPSGGTDAPPVAPRGPVELRVLPDAIERGEGDPYAEEEAEELDALLGASDEPADPRSGRRARSDDRPSRGSQRSMRSQ